MNKQPRLTYIDKGQDTIAPGANLGFYEEFQDLHSLAETIGGTDGKTIYVHAIELHIRVYSGDGDSTFVITPVVVQTAGNLVDTANLAARSVHELLNGACDDVLGYQVLGPSSVARKIPDDATNAYHWGVEITRQVPGNLLQILNKEVETERLQSLHVGLVGVPQTGTSNLLVEYFLLLHYTERRKKVQLR
jgi:hypothetical protein